jgi:hypothetical protein
MGCRSFLSWKGRRVVGFLKKTDELRWNTTICGGDGRTQTGPAKRNQGGGRLLTGSDRKHQNNGKYACRLLRFDQKNTTPEVIVILVKEEKENDGRGWLSTAG